MIDLDFFLETLQRLNCGAILIDGKGLPIGSNEYARNILMSESDKLCNDPFKIRKKIKKLLEDSNHRFMNNYQTLTVCLRENRRPVVIHALPAGGRSDPYAQCLLIILDFEMFLCPSPDTLRQIFGLTSAETNLAVAIARGDNPKEIAHINNVSLATIRKQLASVFSKTGTRRQADLVAILAQAAILPSISAIE